MHNNQKFNWLDIACLSEQSVSEVELPQTEEFFEDNLPLFKASQCISFWEMKEGSVHLMDSQFVSEDSVAESLFGECAGL